MGLWGKKPPNPEDHQPASGSRGRKKPPNPEDHQPASGSQARRKPPPPEPQRGKSMWR